MNKGYLPRNKELLWILISQFCVGKDYRCFVGAVWDVLAWQDGIFYLEDPVLLLLALVVGVDSREVAIYEKVFLCHNLKCLFSVSRLYQHQHN